MSSNMLARPPGRTAAAACPRRRSSAAGCRCRRCRNTSSAAASWPWRSRAATAATRPAIVGHHRLGLRAAHRRSAQRQDVGIHRLHRDRRARADADAALVEDVGLHARKRRGLAASRRFAEPVLPAGEIEVRVLAQQRLDRRVAVGELLQPLHDARGGHEFLLAAARCRRTPRNDRSGPCRSRFAPC